jgi:LuxR family transcriptional regulator, maltose regulon positive regulatory protein
MKTRVQIAAGHLDAAAEWPHDRGLSVDDHPNYLREYEHLTLARLLLARHRVDQPGAAQPNGPASSASPAAAAIGLLDRLHAAAADAGRDGSLLEELFLELTAETQRDATSDNHPEGAVA